MRQPLAIPPGVRAIGTDKQNEGRWRLSDLVRFPNGPDLQPIGGWRVKSTSTLTGKGRAIITWRDNASPPVRHALIGTEQKLYAMAATGDLSDITPAGFTVGSANASASAGYGYGNYGAGAYGTARPDNGSIQPASMWTLDTFGQYPVGCMEDDGKLYIWDLVAANPATAITNAPTGCNAVVVTEEKFVVAIKDRSIEWSDQADETTWTPAATNQAGDLDLETRSALICGLSVSGQTLLFSETDVFAMTYLGGVFVYGVQRVGEVGAVSKGCAVAFNGMAVWMGRGGFYTYNGGAVSDMPCEVADYVFSDINDLQLSKVAAWHNVEFGEIWWHYPSSASSENDRAVAWNYRNGTWATHEIIRYSGAMRGVFLYPLLVANYVYEHEAGLDYGSSIPFARSAPIQLGAGDNVYTIDEVIGDERVMGQAEVVFYGKDSPQGTETTFATVSLATQPAYCRFTARQFEMQVNFPTRADSRSGVITLGMKPRGRR